MSQAKALAEKNDEKALVEVGYMGLYAMQKDPDWVQRVEQSSGLPVRLKRTYRRPISTWVWPTRRSIVTQTRKRRSSMSFGSMALCFPRQKKNWSLSKKF